MTSTEQGVFLPANLRALAGEVASLLASRNETVSVGETAAGGLISASILAIPGSSKIYKGGLTVGITPLLHSLHIDLSNRGKDSTEREC